MADSPSRSPSRSPSHSPSSRPSSRVGRISPSNRITSKEEHHEWALKLWERIDRDHSGTVTLDELNCDEFQEVLHAVIAPESDEAGRRAIYGRAEINIQQALDFCLRKADINGDGQLSFREFKSFLRAMRNEHDSHHVAHMVFALFDLDGTNTIDKDEFIEIFRFFSGRTPAQAELAAIWEQLDVMDSGEVTRAQYSKWLQRHAPSFFKSHAAPVEESESESSGSKTKSGKSSRRPKKKVHVPAPGLLPRASNAPTWTNTWHNIWNERFRGADHALLNPDRPKLLKHYFSAPKTLPELDRFYNRYRGFASHRQALHQPPTPRQKFILSNQSQPEICPERARPGGFARNRFGDSVPWNDEWQDKPCDYMKKKRTASGTLLFRVPKPTPFLLLGRDAPAEMTRSW